MLSVDRLIELRTGRGLSFDTSLRDVIRSSLNGLRPGDFNRWPARMIAVQYPADVIVSISRPRETRQHAGITVLKDDICPGLAAAECVCAALHAAYNPGKTE